MINGDEEDDVDDDVDLLQLSNSERIRLNCTIKHLVNEAFWPLSH